MNSNKIVNLANPTSDQDAATQFYVNAKFTSVPTPTNTNDAANKGYVDTKTTNMATTSSVSTAISTALGSSGTQENRPTVQRDESGGSAVLTFINVNNDFPEPDGTSKRGLLRCDGSLVYSPNTNTLYAGTFSGAVSGSSGYFSGNVGIGTASPSCPLHVASSTSYSGAAVRHIDVQQGGWLNTQKTFDVGFHCAGAIRCGGQIVTDSDKRIKKNVKDIDGNTALSQIRQIRPKIYNYIDEISKTGDVYGFIAQDVKDVILHSTMCSKDYIPNFYCKGNICVIDASNNIYEISSENDFSFEKVIDNSGNEVIVHNVKIYGYDNTEYICSVTQVNNAKNIIVKLDKEYKFSNKQEEYNKIFIYGQEITDFHNLEKDAVWTIATSALQEVDREQQADKARITELEATVAAQQSLINDILERLKKVGA